MVQPNSLLNSVSLIVHLTIILSVNTFTLLKKTANYYSDLYL